MLTDSGIVPVKGGQYKILSDDQIGDLDQATVELLNDVGVKIMHPEALELMEAKGCIVDFEKQIVKIPEEVFRKYLAKAPSNVPLYGRDPKFDVPLDDSDNVFTLGGAGALNYLDLDGIRKPSTMKALEDFTRLEDTLVNYDIAHFLLTPQDIPQQGHEMKLFSHMLKNNTRNFYALPGGGRKGIEFEIEMAAVCAGSTKAVSDRPVFTVGLCIISPLMQRKGFVDELWTCGEYNIPVYVESDAIAGGTTPYTIAGCAVEVNTNVLTAIVLAQMKNPGAPCIYSSSSGILDMKTLDFSGNAPESTLLHMASAQLSHHYGLPYYGACTPDSKLPDTQMGYETMQHFMGLAMAGCNIIHVSIGNLEMMKLASFESCLIADEIFGAAFRFLRGIDTSREAIGLDAFRECGHNSRFLETEHTLNYLRSDERWVPKLTDRNSWNAWVEKTGGKDMRERAIEEAKRILAQHHPDYISRKEAEEIDKISDSAQSWIQNNWVQDIH